MVCYPWLMMLSFFIRIEHDQLRLDDDISIIRQRTSYYFCRLVTLIRQVLEESEQKNERKYEIQVKFPILLIAFYCVPYIVEYCDNVMIC